MLDLGGSASSSAWSWRAFALAEVVTVLFGGVLGDRLPRKLMMEGSAAGSALTQVVIATLADRGLRDHPDARHRRRAQRLPRRAQPAVLAGDDAPDGPAGGPRPRPSPIRPLLQTGAATVGFTLGGVLVAVAGSGWAIGVDALTFAIAAVCYSRLRVEQTLPEGRGRRCSPTSARVRARCSRTRGCGC